MSTTAITRAASVAHETIEVSQVRGAEIVTPEVHHHCVLACMGAPEPKKATTAWFTGFFDEMNCKPHRYDFKTPKGIPQYYHLGYEFAYVYSQQLDALRDRQEVDYVQ